MNHNRILIILQIFCLLSFAAGIIGNVTAADTKDGCQDPTIATTSSSKKDSISESNATTLIDEDTQAKADSLSGTCPKGFHCSCPGCPLYSDLDEDSFCDLGEETEA
jgi:hypothetical protein